MTGYRMTVENDGHVLVQFDGRSFSTKQVEDLQAELEHERGLSRRLASEGTVMATAIQRAREAAAAPGMDAPDEVRQAVGRVLRALAGEVPDGT